MWVLARGLSVDGGVRRIEGTTTSMPSRNWAARALSGRGVQSTMTCGPVWAHPSSPIASTPRLTRWASHQSPAAARRCSLRSTTSSLIATISLGSSPMSMRRYRSER